MAAESTSVAGTPTTAIESFDTAYILLHEFGHALMLHGHQFEVVRPRATATGSRSTAATRSTSRKVPTCGQSPRGLLPRLLDRALPRTRGIAVLCAESHPAQRLIRFREFGSQNRRLAIQHILICLDTFHVVPYLSCMSSIPTISSAPDGTPVVIKRGRGTEAAQRRREAEVLRVAQHPGVVEVRGLRDTAEGLDLELAFVSGSSLADHPPLTIAQLGRVASRVATTLADLHERGVRHGDICAEHILVDHSERTVLCGFGNAGLADDDAAPPVAADVAGLGRFLLHELTRAHDQETINPDDWTAVALAGIGEDALRAARVPGTVTIAPFVARIVDTTGGAGERPSSGPQGLLPTWLSERRTQFALGGVALVGLLIWSIPGVIAGLASEGSVAKVDATTPEPALTPAQPPTSGPEPTLVRAVEAPTCTSTSPFDIDGDGCGDDVSVTEGIITTPDGRWAVGAPTDHVSIGDWNCDGVATPALVVATTGAVYFFTQWSRGEASIFADAAAVVGPTTAIAPASGCGELVATTAAGEVTVGPEGVQS
jgi:serine/threonine protein kinase